MPPRLTIVPKYDTPRVRRVPAYRLERGYRPQYHFDIVNHCPGCGKSHWYVGRFSAECAFCETALPFATLGVN